MGDRIVLRGMRFYGYHGVFPEETRLGQNFSVDIELYTDLRQAGLTDDLGKTADYSRIYTLAKGIVEGPPLQLIEAVAERIANGILAEFPVYEVVVRIHKPGAPLPGPFDCVTVEIYRKRYVLDS